jgi:hypothetical protein
MRVITSEQRKESGTGIVFEKDFKFCHSTLPFPPLPSPSLPSSPLSFWDKVLLYSLGWLWIPDPSASVSRVLGFMGMCHHTWHNTFFLYKNSNTNIIKCSYLSTLDAGIMNVCYIILCIAPYSTQLPFKQNKVKHLAPQYFPYFSHFSMHQCNLSCPLLQISGHYLGDSGPFIYQLHFIGILWTMPVFAIPPLNGEPLWF